MCDVNCDCFRFVCPSWEPLECLATSVQSSSFSGNHHDDNQDEYDGDYHDYHDDDHHNHDFEDEYDDD